MRLYCEDDVLPLISRQAGVSRKTGSVSDYWSNIRGLPPLHEMPEFRSCCGIGTRYVKVMSKSKITDVQNIW